MICVVMLQNCMCCVEGETGACSQTVVKCDVDGTEEVSIKVEESIDIKDEIPEAVSVPSIKTEHEVRLHDVCVKRWQLVLLGLLLPPSKGHCAITLHFFLLCVLFWVPYTFFNFMLQS
jgi:hypothetical protein